MVEAVDHKEIKRSKRRAQDDDPEEQKDEDQEMDQEKSKSKSKSQKQDILMTDQELQIETSEKIAIVTSFDDLGLPEELLRGK